MSTSVAAKLAVFEGKRIRKTLHQGEWWFSIIDVIAALVGGDRPRKYWSDLKQKLLQEGYLELSEKIGQLKMQAPDGKQRWTERANTETLLRLNPTPFGNSRTPASGNPQDCQRVAGGRWGKGGTTTGNRPTTEAHPEGMPELAGVDGIIAQVAWGATGKMSGTSSRCLGVLALVAGGRAPIPPATLRLLSGNPGGLPPPLDRARRATLGVRGLSRSALSLAHIQGPN